MPAREQPNVGFYDVTTGRWRPATDKEQSDALAFREQQRRGSLRDFLKTAVYGTAAVAGAGYGLSALTGGAGATLPSAATQGVAFDTAPVASDLATGLPSGMLPGGSMMSTAFPSVAPAAGSAMSIPWWNIASKAADTLFGIYGKKKQDQSDQKSLDYMRSRDAQTLAYERELEDRRRMEWDRQQAELKRQWDADQAFKQAQWQASEEERLHQRALDDAREARQAPYRAASLSALNNLPTMWSSGGTSPGLGSLGSYRGGGQ